MPAGAFGIEFGCGTGINTVTVCQQGFSMVGLDISPTAVRKATELAKENNCSAQFIVGDMFTPASQSGSFGFAMSIWTLHVVGEQHLRDRHLSECYRVVRPGGYLFLHNESSDDDILNSEEEFVIETVNEWNIPEHANKFDLPDGGQVEVKFPGHMPPNLSGRRSLREHQAELGRAGFQVRDCFEDVMKPHPSVPGNRVMMAFAYRQGSGKQPIAASGPTCRR